MTATKSQILVVQAAQLLAQGFSEDEVFGPDYPEFLKGDAREMARSKAQEFRILSPRRTTRRTAPVRVQC